MEYKINELAKIAGITARTLRHYDFIDLLKPGRIDHNGYRIYGPEEVDLLQQIMLYRELGVQLNTIKILLSKDDYNKENSLNAHLVSLIEKRDRVELLISNVEHTIASMKGESKMNDYEKFEGFKKKMVVDNDQNYGKEVREKYGKETVEKSNAVFMGMTPEDHEKVQELNMQLEEALNAAIENGDPSSSIAQKACSIHKEWLLFFWPDYSKDAHLGMAQMYVDDPRFKKYYDSMVEGGAEFLLDAMKIFCK